MVRRQWWSDDGGGSDDNGGPATDGISIERNKDEVTNNEKVGGWVSNR